MSKLSSLIRASFSQGMELFAYKTKDTASSASKLLMPLGIGAVVVGSLCYIFSQLAEPLHAVGMTHIILTLAIILVSVLALIEGIYKSQDILFNCRDNDLLFSLPIPKQKILTLRVFKLLAFQFIYNLIFLLPAFIIYIYYEQPGLAFYPISFLMLFLVPLIPTALAVVIGYLIRGTSVHFKYQKLVQTLFTLIVFGVVFVISFFMENIFSVIASNATSINEVITRIYYPAGAYNDLIQGFDILKLLGLLAVTIAPLAVVIWLCSVRYFKIISNTKNSTLIKSKYDFSKTKSNSQLVSLTKKELSRYFSSTVYMFNSLVGVFMLLLATGAACIGGTGALELIFSTAEDGGAEALSNIIAFMPTCFIMIIMFTSCMTNITACSISIEGKTFNITKSLPVKVETIFKSKILLSLIITVPLILICSILFFLSYSFDILHIILTLGFALAVPLFSALSGLVVNLKHPKMDAASDTEVVKQSSSTLISNLLGMGVAFVSVVVLLLCADFATIALFGELAIFLVVDLILWQKLKTSGVKLFNNITV